MDKKRERNYQFDNMKALLIFLMVLGHVLEHFCSFTSAGVLYKFIFSFHMAAFLFISGYFAKPEPKRVLSSLIPLYVVFTCVRFALDIIIEFLEEGTVTGWRDFQLFTPRWTLWYLLALIFYQLLLPLVTTENRRYRLLYMLASFVLGIAIGLNHGIGRFLSAVRIFTFLPFFLAGYYEKDSHALSHALRKDGSSKIVAGLAAILLLGGFLFFHERISVTIFYGTELKVPFVLMVSARLLAWIIGFAWIGILLVLMPNRQIPIISKIGANTLPVYLFHSVVIVILEETNWMGFLDHNLFFPIAFSALLTFLLSRNPLERVVRKIRIPLK